MYFILTGPRFDMAAVIDMGEVDEIHSKEETIKGIYNLFASHINHKCSVILCCNY